MLSPRLVLGSERRSEAEHPAGDERASAVRMEPSYQWAGIVHAVSTEEIGPDFIAVCGITVAHVFDSPWPPDTAVHTCPHCTRATH